MTREAAKEILSAFRSVEQDGADPAFLEALEVQSRDPEVKKWFEEQNEIDRMLREKLTQISPPEQLHFQILGRIRRERARVLPPAWLALAAVLVIGGLGLIYSLGSFGPNRFREFRRDALAMVSVQPAPKLDMKTPYLSEAKRFLQEHQAPIAQSLPPALKSMSTAGCSAFFWQEHPASLTCFKLPNGQLLHLVVIDQAAIGNGKIPASFQSEQGWHMMFQQKDGLLLMWASQAPMEKLKQMLVET
ncbi:MAG: hypothetical protein JO271_12795 [Verrucomicrobia bacterium]|nr:hypothetical protein [Verrucomicrobiota bacterium]MBV9272993.1 hypothetical protein [Verrucomicrobiota bacterium]